ncbi:hypothetical protein N5C40_15690 [Pseudomonas fulva]|uniref:hypothetical protein n=1 Tax=Pseudomonas TaxID=286 RepID=UPI00244C5FC3|nr:hypothetical protein [Pseudomonas fulva]MDH1307979.1 hypothetical protein [Pseudomonas fulva]
MADQDKMLRMAERHGIAMDRYFNRLLNQINPFSFRPFTNTLLPAQAVVPEQIAVIES